MSWQDQFSRLTNFYAKPSSPDFQDPIERFKARLNERKRISAAFPERLLARGGYRPPSVAFPRPPGVPKEETIDEITRRWAESKARGQEQGIAPRVSVANATNIKPWIQPEIMRRDPFGMSRLTEEPYSGPSPIEKLPLRQPNQTNLPEPPATPTTDVENSRFLRMPVSKAEFNLEPGTPTPKEKPGFLEGLDEDTRRNLMLSALTTGLKLMSSQRYSTTPQSPVADIGEAGLTGVQTYVGLASADRKFKLLEEERRRKESADKLTGEYRQAQTGFREREVKRHEPGGIDYENLQNLMASRGDTEKVDWYDKDQKKWIALYVPKNLVKYLPPIEKPPETVVQPVWDPESGRFVQKRISKFEQGEFEQPPPGKIVTGTSGKEKKTVVVTPGPGGTYKQIPIMQGEGPSEEREKQRIRKEEAHRLDVAIRDERSSAAAQLRLITQIDGQSLVTAFLSATPGQKTSDILNSVGAKNMSPAGVAKVEAIRTRLNKAETEYRKRAAEYTKGGELVPAPAEETDPLGLFKVDFDKPLTFR